LSGKFIGWEKLLTTSLQSDSLERSRFWGLAAGLGLGNWYLVSDVQKTIY